MIEYTDIHIVAQRIEIRSAQVLLLGSGKEMITTFNKCFCYTWLNFNAMHDLTGEIRTQDFESLFCNHINSSHLRLVKMTIRASHFDLLLLAYLIVRRLVYQSCREPAYLNTWFYLELTPLVWYWGYLFYTKVYGFQSMSIDL